MRSLQNKKIMKQSLEIRLLQTQQIVYLQTEKNHAYFSIIYRWFHQEMRLRNSLIFGILNVISCIFMHISIKEQCTKLLRKFFFHDRIFDRELVTHQYNEEYREGAKSIFSKNYVHLL
ncbi:unnamed protein product [Paramecium sonneborni]|uniref:Transmembrane protein n=1 Tax=Paramecium sonneborni TaxID=65129 RepID=A0A8S1L5X6_9CILI|nr:unnamed protein product [Paramecium sonneborni]